MSAGLLTGALPRERVANFLPEDWGRKLPGLKEPAVSRKLRVVDLFCFFQAEDGIRDYKVTGVQTCALPIYIVQRVDHYEMVDQFVHLDWICHRRHFRFSLRPALCGREQVRGRNLRGQN